MFLFHLPESSFVFVFNKYIKVNIEALLIGNHLVENVLLVAYQ